MRGWGRRLRLREIVCIRALLCQALGWPGRRGIQIWPIGLLLLARVGPLLLHDITPFTMRCGEVPDVDALLSILKT